METEKPLFPLNPKLAPYRLKILALNVGESLVIPWDCFENGKKVLNRERAVSNGKKDFVLIARDYGVEVKCIN